jgi:hypothetical protein
MALRAAGSPTVTRFLQEVLYGVNRATRENSTRCGREVTPRGVPRLGADRRILRECPDESDDPSDHGPSEQKIQCRDGPEVPLFPGQQRRNKIEHKDQYRHGANVRDRVILCGYRLRQQGKGYHGCTILQSGRQIGNLLILR